MTNHIVLANKITKALFPDLYGKPGLTQEQVVLLMGSRQIIMETLIRELVNPDGSAPGGDVERMLKVLREIDGIRQAIGASEEIGQQYQEACCTFVHDNSEALIAALSAPKEVDSDGCYTMPNGECISAGPCIHSPRPAQQPVEADRQEGNFVGRWSKVISELPMADSATQPEQSAIDLEVFRPAVEALEREGRQSEIKDGVLHWTLNAKHYLAQKLFAIIDVAKGNKEIEE